MRARAARALLLLSFLLAAGCSYRPLLRAEAIPRGTRVAFAASRVKAAFDGMARDFGVVPEYPDVSEDLVSRLSAGGRLRFVASAHGRMRGVDLCSFCSDREAVAASASAAGADAVLCVEIRADDRADETRVATYVRLSDAAGAVVWQERSESRVRVQPVGIRGDFRDRLRELALSNNRKLAAALSAGLSGAGR